MKTMLSLLLLTPSLLALDIATLDGTTYRDCRVSQVYPDSICVLFAGGGARIKFMNLPESLRTKFGYDAQRAGAFEKAEATRGERQRALRLAQRQQLQTQQSVASVAARQPPGSQASPVDGNTGAEYVGVQLARSINSAGAGSGRAANQFGGGFGRRTGAQYVGVRFAGPGGGVRSVTGSTPSRP
jgi:hypothetical protein